MSDEIVKGAVEVAKAALDSETGKAIVAPAAKELGKSLETVSATVNLLLEPLAGLVWSYKTIKGFVIERLAPKLEQIPPDRIQPPAAIIAVPTIEALRYAGQESHLRDLYINLLAMAMDADTAQTAHPGFVDVIRQLTPDEAKILPFLARHRYHPLMSIRLYSEGHKDYQSPRPNISHLGYAAHCTFPWMMPEYLDNFQRLGLIHIRSEGALAQSELYDPILEMPDICEAVPDLGFHGERPQVVRHHFEVTSFGRMFCRAVLDEVEELDDATVSIPTW